MGKTFTVMPMAQNYYLEVGKVYEGEITVASPADAEADFHYAVSVTPYSVADEYNTADLVTESNWSQMVKWIEIENPTGVVKPNGTVKVKYRIEVPLDAPAGGQYATIAVRSDEKAAGGEGASVQNVLELASVIFAEVEGETVHAGYVAENTIPGFVAQGTPTVRALVVNSGNVHEAATVEIQVRNKLTNEVLFPQSGEEGEFYEVVMPGASRYVSRELSNLAALGVYEVTQNVTYLGETSYNTVTMVACPIWFIVLAALTVGAVVGTVIALVMRRRHHEQKQISEIG